MPIQIIIALVAALIGLGYSGLRIWTILPVSISLKVLAMVLWVLPLPLMLLQRMPLGFVRVGYVVGSAWIFVLMYVVMTFLVLDIAKIFIPALRTYLSNSLMGSLGVGLFVLAIFLYGNARYHDKERVELTIHPTHPPKRDYKIVALSDLHLGLTIGKGELARWVEMINAERPDLILIAGDLVDGDTRPLMADSVYTELNKLQAPLGVYACLGNHEYLGGEAARRTFLSKTNIVLLQDSVATIADDLYIVGRDDRSNPARKATADLVAGLDRSRSIILLDHQPHDLAESEHAGIDLQISGHTHRGQVFPINIIVDQLYEQSHGYHRRGNTQYYVSSGLGLWGGKFRIGTQSEYVVINYRHS